MLRHALLVILAVAAWSGEGTARHVILLIGDGMELSHEVAASRYLHGADRALSFHALPYQGAMTTWDVTAYNAYARAAGRPLFAEQGFDPVLGYDHVRGGAFPSLDDVPEARAYLLARLLGGREAATDSASSGTAIATGQKTDDGNLAWRRGDPPDGRLVTIAELARAAGARTGVVSTVPFSHATPAAFVAHNVHRGNYAGTGPAAIDHEIIHLTRPEVVIGGGHPQWDPRFIHADNLAALRADPGWLLVERTAGVAGGSALVAATEAALAADRRLFGLFGGRGGFFGFRTLARGEPAATPATSENPTLAEATVAALRVLTRDGTSTGSSFLMVEQGDIDWANHGNDYQAMVGGVIDLDEAVRAAVAFVNRPGDAVDWDNTLIIVTSDHANGLLRLRRTLGRGELPAVDRNGRPTDGSADYGTGNHTNEPVMVYARGAGLDLLRGYEGSWNRGTRLIDNTHLFHVMRRALGLPVPPGQEELSPAR